jgi:hypothetical protein
MLDDVRQLRKLEQAIATETRAVARLLRSSNDRLSSVLHGYLEQTGRIVIGSAQYDGLLDANGRLLAENDMYRRELGSARTAELERARDGQPGA